MLTWVPRSVNATLASSGLLIMEKEGEGSVANIQIDEGIIRILNLEIQDPKAAAVLAAYPQTRWAEIARRAVKIGLGYLKGGEHD
jgi:hypothetical protein